MRRIGALSIGESPRPDLLQEITPCIAADRITQWGAMDGMHPQEVWRPEYDVPLITKLGGETVLVERAWMAQRLQQLIDQHHAQVDAFIILCAEDFSSLRAPVPLFIPYVLTRKALEATSFGGRLGIVCPVSGQVTSCKKKWDGSEWKATVEVASPFVAPELDDAVERLLAAPSDLILLDCTSFSQEQARHLSVAHQRSVVAVRSFAWTVLKEFVIQQ